MQRSLIRYSATLPRIKVSLRRGPRIFPFTTSRA
ncbi:Serine protease sepA precursor, partial (plasmid) [Escherichia coli O104:H4 str. E92/11]